MHYPYMPKKRGCSKAVWELVGEVGASGVLQGTDTAVKIGKWA